jgi:hypothetical protein
MKRALCIAAVLCLAALATAQTAPATSSTEKKASKPAPTTIMTGKKHAKFAASSIEVMEFKPADIKVPAQFEMAMYENTITELQKLKKFKNVYREGDKRAASDPGCLKLKALIWEFKEGSARQRQVTTVKGATSLHVTIHIEDASGKALVDKDVAGAVHFMGENLRATYNLAQNIAGVVDANFD